MSITRRGFLGTAAAVLSMVPGMSWAKPAPEPVQPKKPRKRRRKQTDAEQDLAKIWEQKEAVWRKWVDGGLGDMVKCEPHEHAVETACALENQRLMNEELCGDENFRKISLFVTSELYRKPHIYDLVGLQVMLGPTGLGFWRDGNDELWRVQVAAGTRKMRTVWSMEAVQDLVAVHGLDPTWELSMLLASEMQIEMIREIVTTIRHAATVYPCPVLPSNLPGFLTESFVRLSNGCGRANDPDANWLMTSPEMAEQIMLYDQSFKPAGFLKDFGFMSSLGPNEVGRTKDYRLYQDPLFPQHEMLMGSKHGAYGAGLVYMPYIPATLTPTVLDMETFCPRKGIIHRYGMAMPDTRMYARAVVTTLAALPGSTFGRSRESSGT